MTTAEHEAMEIARHELVTLDGLLAADAVAPTETWVINTKASVAKLDAVLSAVSDTDMILS